MFPDASTAREITEGALFHSIDHAVDRILAKIGNRILREAAIGGSDINVIDEQFDEVVTFLVDKGYTVVYKYGSDKIEGHYHIEW